MKSNRILLICTFFVAGLFFFTVSVAAQTIFDCTSVTEIPIEECEALVALYNSTDGDNWTDNSNWLITDTPCSWYGISCDAGFVSRISLYGNQLSGAIPPALGDLNQLTRLYLFGNQLLGEIPPELGNLSQLNDLLLMDNQLSGEIPPELGNLSQLTLLELDRNQLSGEIPAALGNLTQLTRLVLHSNQLSGPIPPVLGNLSQLTLLYLSNNQLSGEIPDALGNLTQLDELSLNYNQLSGTIPPALGNLTNLTRFFIYDNPLVGPLPSSLTNLALEYFYFSDTGLCEPGDNVFQNWLSSITYLNRTNVTCPSDTYDQDNDGYTVAEGDCDDNDSNINPGATEICDGIDNDCNGQVDEDWSTLGELCFAYELDYEKIGRYQCDASDYFQVCCGYPGGLSPDCLNGNQTQEICDYYDNDCNGQTDEFWPDLGQPCIEGVGACQASGWMRCDGSDPSGNAVCSATPGVPSTEICDGIDNDCDGDVDEGVCGDNPPVAIAGLDQLVSMGELGLLDGSASYDIDGDPLTYSWVSSRLYPLGPQITLDSLTTVTTTFTAPDEVGSYMIRLVVRDSTGKSDYDELYVTVLENKDYAVFVSGSLGDDANDGSMEAPVETMDRAFQLASSTSCGIICIKPRSDIYIHEDIYYSDTLALLDNMSVYGGFYVSNNKWTRTASGETTLTGDTTILEIRDISHRTVVDGLTIIAYGGLDEFIDGGFGENSIGIYIQNSNSNLIIQNNKIKAGKGGDGADGYDGLDGNDGQDGNPGTFLPTHIVSDLPRARGGSGGNGASYYGLFTTHFCPDGGRGGTSDFNEGWDGYDGEGPLGGGGGTAGIFSDKEGGGGVKGTVGNVGANGVNTNADGIIVKHNWIGTQGGLGTVGTCGSGAGGGGAGYGGFIFIFPLLGGSGGGGGGAGSPGIGGQGGYAGGGSFGIFLSDSSPEIHTNEIYTQGGGEGGIGGLPGCGGSGGEGGIGGSSIESYTGWGGNGGDGGTGGHGGGGAGGHGGPSFSIYEAGTSQAVDYNNYGTVGEGGLGGVNGQVNSDCPNAPLGENGEPGLKGEALPSEEVVTTIPQIVIPGGSTTNPVGFPPGSSSGRFESAWGGSDVVMTLTSPSGRVIGRNTTGSDVFHANGATWEFYEVDDPEAGEWLVELFGEDIPPGGEEVVLNVYATMSNNPPLAVCQDVQVNADESGSAEASIDAGSHDPDGWNPLSIIESPEGPFGLGDITVTLTIDDGQGLSDTCQATVTVIDTAAPIIECADLITVAADSNCQALFEIEVSATDNCDAVNIISDAPSVYPLGLTEVTFTATDTAGNSASCMTDVIVADESVPVISCPADITLLEPVTWEDIGMATGSAECETPFIVIDAPETFELGDTVVTWTAYTSSDTALCQQIVTVVEDADGDSIPDDTDNCAVYNPGQADKNSDGQGDACDPAVTSVTGPANPVAIDGTPVSLSGSFTDADDNDSHTVHWDWGDATSTSGSVDQNTNSVSGSHTYTEAGVYAVTLIVFDSYPASDEAVFEYVVIYDPEGGFVTGGGWIDSPEGAYYLDTALSGKATFGFVSKYQKGTSILTGKTEFQFKVADLNFKSTSYEWLVIAGKRATFKGLGTINGEGEFRFMLSAIDGDLQGGDGLDKFRIKIWDAITDQIVYDNHLGEVEDADPATELGGGSIVIHKDK